MIPIKLLHKKWADFWKWDGPYFQTLKILAVMQWVFILAIVAAVYFFGEVE